MIKWLFLVTASINETSFKKNDKGIVSLSSLQSNKRNRSVDYTCLERANKVKNFGGLKPNKELFKINDDKSIEFFYNNSEKVERLFSMVLDSSSSLKKRGPESNMYKIQRNVIYDNSMPNYDKKMIRLREKELMANIKVVPAKRQPFNFDYNQNEDHDHSCNSIKFPPW